MFKDMEVADQLQVYLEEKGFKPNEIPCTSQLLKILAALPAQTTKAMAGIDDIQEKAMRSFQDLETIARDLKQHGLPRDHSNDLVACIGSSKTYLRSYFKDNISGHSNIGSHCISHALSDVTSSEFNAQCPEDDHSQKCDHCEAFNDLMKCMRGTIKKYHKQPKSLEFREMLHNVETANQNIFDYRAHLIRTVAQEVEWTKLREKLEPHVAFAILDWAMKVMRMFFLCKKNTIFFIFILLLAKKLNNPK